MKAPAWESRFQTRRLVGVLAIGLAISNALLAAVLVARSDVWAHPDAAYYTAAARDLIGPQRGTESVVIHHAVQHAEVTHPAFDYWQPLLPIVVAAVSVVLGSPFVAAKVVVWLLGSVLLPVSVYVLSRTSGSSRTAGLLALLLVMFLPQLEPFRTMLDTVTLAGVFLTVGVSLIAQATVAGMASRRRQLTSAVLGGLCFGLAAVSRGDALVVSAVILLVLVVVSQDRHVALAAAAGLVAGYAPLMVRTYLTFGTPFPPGSAHVPYISEPFELLNFPRSPHASIAAVVLGRVWTLPSLRHVLFGMPLVTLAVGMALAVAAVRWAQLGAAVRRDRYTVTCLLAIAGFFGFLAAGALLAPAVTQWAFRAPVPYVPMLVAVAAAACERIGQDALKPGWRLAGALLLAAVFASNMPLDPFRMAHVSPPAEEAKYADAAAMLPTTATVLTNASVQLYLHHGFPGGVIRVPSNGEAAIAAAIDHYGADYLILFGARRSTDPREYSDSTVDRVWEGSKWDIRGVRVFSLHEVARTSDLLVAAIQRETSSDPLGDFAQ